VISLSGRIGGRYHSASHTRYFATYVCLSEVEEGSVQQDNMRVLSVLWSSSGFQLRPDRTGSSYYCSWATQSMSR
jgi:hypothetical protein